MGMEPAVGGAAAAGDDRTVVPSPTRPTFWNLHVLLKKKHSRLGFLVTGEAVAGAVPVVGGDAQQKMWINMPPRHGPMAHASICVHAT